MTGKRARTLLGSVPHEQTVKEIGTKFRQSRGSLPHTFGSRPPEPSFGVQARSPVLVCNDAKVAELADAPDLGSGTRKGMGVRVPPFANHSRFVIRDLNHQSPITHHNEN